jgi:hypothetical protein
MTWKGSYNNPTKDKVTLSLAILLYKPKLLCVWGRAFCGLAVQPVENEVDPFMGRA